MTSSAIIGTFTGKRMDLLHPLPELVCIEDIAHALARQCRFGGHIREGFYSVAQHSILVASILPPELQLAGLLHDASEAYLVDVPSPIKHSPFLSGYRELEGKMQEVIYEKFGLPLEEDPLVKQADRVLVNTEARDLMACPSWVDLSLCLPEKIEPWRVERAEETFLLNYESLRDEQISTGRSYSRYTAAPMDVY